jgi:hypothetical protein
MMLRVRCFAKISIFRLQPIRSNSEAPILQARPGKSGRRSSCSTPVDRSPYDDRAGGRSSLCQPHLSMRSIRERSHETRRLRSVAASCILRCGALDAAMCFACLSHPCGCSKPAHSSSSHLAMLRRLPDDRASSLEDGHAPCSSFDAHVVLAFSVPAPALVFRRSRPPPLRGLFRRPPPAFATDVPRLSPFAFTTKSSWSSTPSRACRARLSTNTGNTPSAHSPRAREFVSRFDESRRRSSSFGRSRPHLALGHCARPRLSTMALARP